ncbi:hypothetical protein F5Y12DRAFT_776061 [Xylaria sp. FL1777]|nr:hypothetical protein F5Y12DRAFT_776061 [Xylaria sp. FL1777]
MSEADNQRSTEDDWNMNQLEKMYRDIYLEDKIHRTGSYDELCSKLGKTKVFVSSTPRGAPADKCVESLRPHIRAGDVIIDCGNEHWDTTERCQREFDPKSVQYIGCGVSGGRLTMSSGMRRSRASCRTTSNIQRGRF